ncbi:glycosyltransferase [Sphingopyxis sp. MG]|uniref:glycosyltransferase n=1 Tax=Sphingopyxis sp. MG TaxID=1866325 RepID=UPI000CDF3274|nr:glycosyltransferase [Sphingopyxis sp. MG]AVA13630.1 hypothetical protein C3E99_07060 [Sphingopyxis sp. MG]
MDAPSILIFVSAYLPGYKGGGPIQSIANLIDRLGGEFNFRIVAADRDLGDALPYPGVRPLVWHQIGKAQVMYLRPNQRGFSSIARILRETPHDLLYLNSFFDPHFSSIPLLAQYLGVSPRKRVLLAPRGEFSEGALRLRAAKKRLFMAVTRTIGLHRDLIWQATALPEVEDISRVIRGADVRLIPNLPRPKQDIERVARAPGLPLRIVFLSRISPKKNLLFALNVLERVRTPVDFTIYGPHEDATYWDRCAAVIDALPSHVRVNDAGPLEPTQVAHALAAHDLFFLPTLGENYGHVIAEALEAGLRLLLSDQTPWRGLEGEGVGYDLPLSDPAAFVAAIEAEAAIMQTVGIAERLAKYRERMLRIDMAVESNRQLFSEAAVAV